MLHSIDGYCAVPINNRDAEQQRQRCAQNGFVLSSDIDPGSGNMLCKKGDGDGAADMNEAAYSDFDTDFLRSSLSPSIAEADAASGVRLAIFCILFASRLVILAFVSIVRLTLRA